METHTTSGPTHVDGRRRRPQGPAALVSPAMDSWLQAWRGRDVGPQHRVVRHLATGGMSHVFLIEHKTLGESAAAKVLLPGSPPEMRRYFEREAALLARIEHPNIVRSTDFGELPGGEHYLVMEHVAGVDLASYLKSVGRIAPARVLRILRQVASALDHLHGLGIVHRDIKPANLMLDPAHDTVKLIDFGIARRIGEPNPDEGPGTLAGTPAYMPPEQAQGEEIGPAADNYSLGALALEMLTGEPPFAHLTPFQLVMAVVAEEPAPPSARGLVIDGLDAVIQKALAKAPEDRFASAGALVAALERVLPPRAALCASNRARVGLFGGRCSRERRSSRGRRATIGTARSSGARCLIHRPALRSTCCSSRRAG